MTVDLDSPSFLDDPYPTLARLRRDTPLARVRMQPFSEVWFLSRYDDVMRALRDKRLGNDPAAAYRGQSAAARWLGTMWPLRRLRLFDETVIASDGSAHRRRRDVLQQAFSPAAVAALAPRIRAMADELLAPLRSGAGVDLVAEFALPLSLAVIGERVGIPSADLARCRSWAVRLVSQPGHGAWPLAQQLRAAGQMQRFFRALIRRRRRHPCEDLISAMLQGGEGNDRLSDEEIVRFSFLLLFAGYETPATFIAGAVLALLEHPDQLEALRRGRVAPERAIEELLRFTSAAPLAFTRYAREAIEIHGGQIEPNAPVVLSLASANRDESRFPSAERLDLGRDPNPHLAFGAGPHHCLGAQLARLEGSIAIEVLNKRFPRLRLDVARRELRWQGPPALRRLVSLPVRM
jgi:cytochrome P450